MDQIERIRVEKEVKLLLPKKVGLHQEEIPQGETEAVEDQQTQKDLWAKNEKLAENCTRLEEENKNFKKENLVLRKRISRLENEAFAAKFVLDSICDIATSSQRMVRQSSLLHG